jgi:predicted dehydrogenase
VKRRFLVVGCGSIGRRHLRNLRVLEAGALLAFDPQAERRAEAARESGAAAVEGLEQALDLGLDACLICSPSALHAAQAVAAAACCHLFIEKPIGVTYADALRVRRAAEEHGRVCLVGCNLRFHPGVAALKRGLEGGAIGRPLAIRAEVGQYLPDWHPWEDYRRGYSARRDLGGGVLLDAIHEIDLVRWLCGEFEEVEGLCGRAGDLEIETEDLGLLIGRTRDGVWCEVHLDYLQRCPARHCKIIGTDGTMTWDVTAGQTTLLRPGVPPAVLCDFRGLDPNAMYLDEMRHFLRCLAGQEPPAQDADAAAEAVRVVERFRRLEGFR